MLTEINRCILVLNYSSFFKSGKYQTLLDECFNQSVEHCQTLYTWNCRIQIESLPKKQVAFCLFKSVLVKWILKHDLLHRVEHDLLHRVVLLKLEILNCSKVCINIFIFMIDALLPLCHDIFSNFCLVNFVNE